jgi:glycosyltransferase involved in cell wall biosynthesis
MGSTEKIIKERGYNKEQEKEKIYVSIWCMAYNHEPYIKDAIEGFLAQKTAFKYEIIIHDDASTDRTVEIIKEYEQRYPSVIRGIYQEKNQYQSNPQNLKWLSSLKMKHCKGKYIALCEGDDFWIDCHKLQIQVDYMEEHADCSLYIHNGIKLNCQNGTVQAIEPYDGKKEKNISAEEAIMQYRGHPPTASMLFKAGLLKSPDFFMTTPVGDYPTQLFCLTQGKIHYSSRIMSVYRWLSKDSYNSEMLKSKKKKFTFNLGMVRFLDQYDQYTNYEYHVWLVSKIMTHVCGAIAAADSQIPLAEYYNICEQQGLVMTPEYKVYLKEMECLRKQLFDEEYCSDKLKKFTEKYKNIVVMGAGVYGAKLAAQLENNHIDFQGFAVSQKGKNEEMLKGKQIWQLSELPFTQDDTGVVVGILPFHWDNIMRSLKKAKIKHYICPFFLEYEKQEKM